TGPRSLETSRSTRSSTASRPNSTSTARRKSTPPSSKGGRAAMTSNRFRIAAAVLLSGAFALSLVSPASAFIRITRQGTNGIVQNHWNVADLPVPSVINPTNNDKSDAVTLPIIIAAAQHWQDIPTSFFTVNAHQYTGSPPEIPPALAFDGQNSVLFDPT